MAVGIISPVELYLQYKRLWENHDLTVLPLITYIYLCGQIYALYLHYQRSSNRAQTELKCKTGFRETIYNWHYHIQTVGA
jgi:hypothetical protein